jgi:hypothetical protein
MERRPLVLSDGKISQASDDDIIYGRYSYKRIEDEVLTIPKKIQMVVCGDFKIIGNAELVILADGELANIKG